MPTSDTRRTARGTGKPNGVASGGSHPYRALLDIKAVAEWLGLSVRSCEELVASGYLTPIRVKGRIRRFAPEQVEAYIRSVTENPGGRA